MSAKNLNKKIRRLVERIEKDTRKLAKLHRKLADAAVKRKAEKKKKAGVAAPRPKAKKRAKPKISNERRAELSAAMKARWAAKRAAKQSGSSDSGVADGAQSS